MGTNKKTTIAVQGTAITVVSQREEDFCSMSRSLAAVRPGVAA